jgi:hypothetical protein
MTTFWTIWLFGLLPLSFAAAEAYAIATGRTTLSRYVWNLSKRFLPIIFIAGFLSGFLCAHFWWGGMAACF